MAPKRPQAQAEARRGDVKQATGLPVEGREDRRRAPELPSRLGGGRRGLPRAGRPAAAGHGDGGAREPRGGRCPGAYHRTSLAEARRAQRRLIRLCVR